MNLINKNSFKEVIGMSEYQTQMVSGKQREGFSARYIVAMVITALIYGSIIFITRFLPTKLGTVQLFYPAAIAAPLFGIWFGIWGSTGLVLGNVMSMVVVGMNPLTFPFALLGQGVMGLIPGLAYRKVRFENKGDVVRFVIAVVIGIEAGCFLVAYNLVKIQGLPGAVVWGSIFPWMQFSNVLMAAVFAPLLFKWFSDYMNKSGLFFKSFLG